MQPVQPATAPEIPGGLGKHWQQIFTLQGNRKVDHLNDGPPPGLLSLSGGGKEPSGSKPPLEGYNLPGWMHAHQHSTLVCWKRCGCSPVSRRCCTMCLMFRHAIKSLFQRRCSPFGRRHFSLVQRSSPWHSTVGVCSLYYLSCCQEGTQTILRVMRPGNEVKQAF